MQTINLYSDIQRLRPNLYIIRRDLFLITFVVALFDHISHVVYKVRFLTRS